MTHGGKREGAGRPKGSLNRRSQEIRSFLEEMGCDPIKGIAEISQKAKGDNDINMELECYKILVPYIAPKLKSVENTEISGDVTYVINTGVPCAPNELNQFDKESNFIDSFDE